jgi:hypothetical protein
MDNYNNVNPERAIWVPSVYYYKAELAKATLELRRLNKVIKKQSDKIKRLNLEIIKLKNKA